MCADSPTTLTRCSSFVCEGNMRDMGLSLLHAVLGRRATIRLSLLQLASISRMCDWLEKRQITQPALFFCAFATDKTRRSYYSALVYQRLWGWETGLSIPPRNRRRGIESNINGFIYLFSLSCRDAYLLISPILAVAAERPLSPIICVSTARPA